MHRYLRNAVPHYRVHNLPDMSERWLIRALGIKPGFRDGPRVNRQSSFHYRKHPGPDCRLPLPKRVAFEEEADAFVGLSVVIAATNFGISTHQFLSARSPNFTGRRSVSSTLLAFRVRHQDATTPFDNVGQGPPACCTHAGIRLAAQSPRKRLTCKSPCAVFHGQGFGWRSDSCRAFMQLLNRISKAQFRGTECP